ncbi:MAG TPA: universal stress protein [Dehalococcoidia bacterium]|nr:universal stress protein [Dehalococcoidia bacterium]
MSALWALLGWLVIVIVSMAVAVYLARRWGRDPFGWALLSAGMGPFAVVALISTRRRDVVRPASVELRRTRHAERNCVLIPVDGPDSAMKLARHAIAEMPEDEVVILYVMPREWQPPNGAISDEERERRVAAATGQAADALRAAGMPVEVAVTYGDPREEILRVAAGERVSHILVGRRGAGMTKALMGSVSSHVVRNATCPVTVVD